MSEQLAVIDDLLERVVNMKLYGISDDDVCEACAINETQLGALMETSEYRAKLANQTVEKFEENKTLNDGWDGLEARSLATLGEVLEFSRDPDLALKVAVAANRATRRGAKNDHQIPMNAGARAVINLNETFINVLQQNVNVAPRKSREIEKKQQDFLDPKKLEDLLEVNATDDNRVEGMLTAAQLTITGEPGE